MRITTLQENLENMIGTSSALNPIANLYNKPLPATRSGSLFNAFPYPTKISPEAIALFIATHTQPGDTVFDGFAGSGTTGLAALLCGNPPQKLRDEAERLGLNVNWGTRNAILYELSALGAFIAQNLTNPPDPATFRDAANELLVDAEKVEGWMYRAKDPNGNDGIIRYIVWSDILQCPVCHAEVSLWDACVRLNPASISSEFQCPSCDHKCHVDNVGRISEMVKDDVLDQNRESRARCIARVFGVTGKRTWSRPVINTDELLMRRIEHEDIPKTVPCVAIPWGDLYRSGYHKGISHIHHFYTRRNLIIFARLWERTACYSENLRDALRFWLLSYNTSHATIMTRVVAKSGQKELVVTSAQPGVLYISGLPVEKNLFAGLRRKLSTITEAFQVAYGQQGRIEVQQRSSCHINLPTGSVDYVFTDPPFGGNIPYAEINFINEAWLGCYTDRTDEAIISKHERKSVSEYQALLSSAFNEVHRILKLDGKATLVFHSASAEVWNALQAAYTEADFGVEYTSVLDKKQGSFKQVTTNGAVKGDPLLLLSKHLEDIRPAYSSISSIIDKIEQQAEAMFDPAEKTTQRLYSRLVNYCMANRQHVPLDAVEFYDLYEQRSPGVTVGAHE